MTVYRHPDLNDHYVTEFNERTDERLREYFGDVPILIRDGNCFGDHDWASTDEGAPPANLITFHCESRPVDRGGRVISGQITAPYIGPEATNGTFFINYLQDATTSPGWFDVEMMNMQDDGAMINVAQFHPEDREFHTTNPYETLAHYIAPYDGNMDAMFGDFRKSISDPEWLATHEAERLEAQMDAFQEFITQVRTSPIESIEASISEEMHELIASEERITQIKSQLDAYRAQLDAALARLDQPVEADARRELESIQRHAKVVGVEIDHRNRLIVSTKNLMLPHPNGDDEDAILGEYDIVLDFRTNKALPRNLTNRKGTYDHPHVHDGSFCSGTWGPTIHQLMENRQIAAAVGFVIDTLEHCNPDDDWGRSYRHWFTVENNDEALARSTRS